MVRLSAPILVLILCIASGYMTSTYGQSAGDVTIHDANPRYFERSDGSPIFLRGYYAWASVDPDTYIDHPSRYEEMILQAEQYGFNYIRISLGINRFTASTNPPSWDGQTSPTPFLYVSGKADLDQWDPVFWNGLRYHIETAAEHDVSVHVAFFDGVGIRGGYEVYRWVGSYWNVDNQVASYYGDLDTNGDGNADQEGEFYRQDDFDNNSGVGTYQRRLIDKAIVETEGYDNVFYEVGNELIGAPPAWTDSVVGYIRQRTSKAVTWNGANDDQGLDTENDGYSRHDGNSPAEVLALQTSSRISGGKPFWIDPDGSALIGGTADDLRRSAWYAFTRGTAGWGGFSTDFWDSGADTVKASYYGNLASFVDSVDFVEMAPDSSLISNNTENTVLAKSGSEYVAYVLNDSEVTLDLTGLLGQASFRVFDPRVGSFGSESTVDAGQAVAFTKPSGLDDWVLHVKTGTGTGGPEDPSELSVGTVTTSSIDLFWMDNSDNETGFQLERAPGASGGSFAEIASLGPDSTSYTDAGLSAGATYRYRVRAFNAQASSAYSNTVTQSTLSPGGGELSCNDISDLTVATSRAYQCALLQSGDGYYIDREYTLVTLPSLVSDAVWIQTANDDKAETAEEFLSFTSSRNITVYVGYDSRATSLPDWLSAWEPVVDRVYVSDSGMGFFSLHRRDFAAGVVRLGANMAAGASGSQSQYVVAMVETGVQTEIFADGFESGDLSVWSSAMGEVP